MPRDNHQCHKTPCHTPTQFHNRHTESYRMLGGGASKHNLSTLDFQIQWQPLWDRKSILDLGIHTFGHSLFLLAQFQTSPPSRASLLPQARLGTAKLATASSFILLASLTQSLRPPTPTTPIICNQPLPLFHLSHKILPTPAKTRCPSWDATAPWITSSVWNWRAGALPRKHRFPGKLFPTWVILYRKIQEN